MVSSTTNPKATPATIKQCVMEGIGITILPEVTVAQDIAQGRLASLAWEEEKLEVATLMIWYKDRWLSPTLSAFIEMTKEVLRAGNAQPGAEGINV